VPTGEQAGGLIAAYADGPRLLEAALVGLSDEELRFTPGPEHWSIHENVIHVVDVDLVGAARIRYLLAEPGATPASFYGYRWSRILDYQAHSMPDALAFFRAVRKWTGALLERLPSDAWARTGVHWEQDGSGGAPTTLTLAQAVEHFTGHVEYHLRTIAKRRAQYAERGTQS